MLLAHPNRSRKSEKRQGKMWLILGTLMALVYIPVWIYRGYQQKHGRRPRQRYWGNNYFR